MGVGDFPHPHFCDVGLEKVKLFNPSLAIFETLKPNNMRDLRFQHHFGPETTESVVNFRLQGVFREEERTRVSNRTQV